MKSIAGFTGSVLLLVLCLAPSLPGANAQSGITGAGVAHPAAPSAALISAGVAAQAPQNLTASPQTAGLVSAPSANFNAMSAAEGGGAPKYLTVTGAGTDTENDQSTADQNAASQAQTNMQNACPGTLTRSQKIYDVCSQIGNNYMCSVNYVGMCEISN